MKTTTKNAVKQPKQQPAVGAAGGKNGLDAVMTGLRGLGFAPEHLSLIGQLKFPEAALLTKGPKAATDVAEAFSGTVLTTIANSSVLGGPELVSTIKTQLDQHARLVELDKLIDSMTRLVRQNLFVVGSELASTASVVIATAKANGKKNPQLVEGLKPAQGWMAKHHPGRPGKATEPAPEKK